MTTQVMGTLRAVDSYVADLIAALRKAFKVAQNMTQTEALRQMRRHDRKALTVTLNKGDVVLMNVDVPVYIIENQRGQRQTLTKIDSS